MKSKVPFFIALMIITAQLHAQVEPDAGLWKTWFISSGVSAEY